MEKLDSIRYPLAHGLTVSIRILREDLNQPLLQGNKFWKLKYNLAEVKKTNIKRLLTFGGAYSNHIHATALAGKLEGIETIGVIRGEQPNQYSPTLLFAQEQGMRLHFISRENYRHKTDTDFLEKLENEFGPYHLVPEGGSNELGLKGCMDWGKRIAHQADIYCLAAGTGCTAAGIAKSLLFEQPKAEIWAFSALKNGGFLKEEAEKIAQMALPNLSIQTDYHFGGYAKYSPALLQFITEIENSYQIPLEQVYTGKAFYGMIDLLKKNVTNSNKDICFIHTGGLQGKIRS